MKTIWKYTLAAAGWQVVNMPAEAQILSVAEQNGEIVLYALVDPSKAPEQREVWTVGTGRPVPDAALQATFIGTVKLEGGLLMFHVFAS